MGTCRLCAQTAHYMLSVRAEEIIQRKLLYTEIAQIFTCTTHSNEIARQLKEEYKAHRPRVFLRPLNA